MPLYQCFLRKRLIGAQKPSAHIPLNSLRIIRRPMIHKVASLVHCVPVCHSSTLQHKALGVVSWNALMNET